MKLIPLTRGLFAKIDDVDFNSVSKFKWRSLKTKYGKFYAVRSRYRDSDMRSDTIYLHRFIMGEPAGMDVDHKNNDRLDCQRLNLRVCTRRQNLQNRSGARKNSLSGVRGVCYHRTRERWVAQIQVDGKNRTLGYFPSKELAAACYAEANKKYFGEFGGRL